MLLSLFLNSELGAAVYDENSLKLKIFLNMEFNHQNLEMLIRQVGPSMILLNSIDYEQNLIALGSSMGENTIIVFNALIDRIPMKVSWALEKYFQTNLTNWI